MKFVLNTLLFLFTVLTPDLHIGLTAQSSGKQDTYVGKAGDMFISEEEFVRRFEMLPALNRRGRSRLDQEKMEFLYSLIAEKLLAQEATARKLDEDSVFIRSYNEIRKMLGRDELYRDEVSRKVSPSRKDVDQGMARALRQLLVAYIYVDRKESADFIRSQLHQARDFDRLQLDSSLHADRDTATVIWGDAEGTIEEASYRLNVGAISPVVHSGEGFYILKLISNQPNSTYTAMQVADLRVRVKELVRTKQEHARTLDFIQKFLREKAGYSRPAPFTFLSKTLQEVYDRHDGDSLIRFDTELYDEVKRECAASLKDTFVVAGNTWWSMEEVLEKLFVKGFTIRRGNTKSIPRVLNAAIRDWVYDELLGQEALARHLDTRYGVQRELEMWHQQFLAEMMRSYIRAHVALSDAEVWTALHAEDSQFSIPRVRIRELKTRNIDEMKSALDDLQRGESFENIVEHRSTDAELRRTKGIVDYFPITEHAPVGEIAWEMSVGQRFGPISVENEYVYFELLGKDQSVLRKDSAAASSYESAKKEVYRMKLKRTTDLFLAQAGERRGFDIYQESLANLKVTPVPMMTFRLLGFGGRMFAVPFVAKQIDWVNVDPPSSTVIP